MRRARSSGYTQVKNVKKQIQYRLIRDDAIRYDHYYVAQLAKAILTMQLL
jgi:hypothetical protein